MYCSNDSSYGLPATSNLGHVLWQGVSKHLRVCVCIVNRYRRFHHYRRLLRRV